MKKFSLTVPAERVFFSKVGEIISVKHQRLSNKRAKFF